MIHNILALVCKSLAVIPISSCSSLFVSGCYVDNIERFIFNLFYCLPISLRATEPSPGTWTLQIIRNIHIFSLNHNSLSQMLLLSRHKNTSYYAHSHTFFHLPSTYLYSHRHISILSFSERRFSCPCSPFVCGILAHCNTFFHIVLVSQLNYIYVCL